MNTILLDAAKNANNQQGGGMWTLLIIYVLIFVGIYFILIRPKSKRSKQEEELRNSLEIGDNITTIGGIVGRVVAIREEDDEIIIETGSDRTKMVFKRWAVSTVNNDKEDKKQEKEEKQDKKSFFGKKKKTEENSPAEK